MKVQFWPQTIWNKRDKKENNKKVLISLKKSFKRKQTRYKISLHAELVGRMKLVSGRESRDLRLLIDHDGKHRRDKRYIGPLSASCLVALQASWSAVRPPVRARPSYPETKIGIRTNIKLYLRTQTYQGISSVTKLRRGFIVKITSQLCSWRERSHCLACYIEVREPGVFGVRLLARVT